MPSRMIFLSLRQVYSENEKQVLQRGGNLRYSTVVKSPDALDLSLSFKRLVVAMVIIIGWS